MRTSSVIISSLIAAGATGVQARPFFGNPADMSLSGLSAHDEGNHNAIKRDAQTHGPTDGIHLAADAHLKTPITGVGAGACKNGLPTEDCKNIKPQNTQSPNVKDKSATPNASSDADGKCDDNAIKALQVKLSAAITKNGQLQQEVTGYKHQIIDYQHNIDILQSQVVDHPLNKVNSAPNDANGAHILSRSYSASEHRADGSAHADVKSGHHQNPGQHSEMPKEDGEKVIHAIGHSEPKQTANHQDLHRDGQDLIHDKHQEGGKLHKGLQQSGNQLDIKVGNGENGLNHHAKMDGHNMRTEVQNTGNAMNTNIHHVGTNMDHNLHKGAHDVDDYAHHDGKKMDYTVSGYGTETQSALHHANDQNIGDGTAPITKTNEYKQAEKHVDDSSYKSAQHIKGAAENDKHVVNNKIGGDKGSIDAKGNANVDAEIERGHESS